LNKVTLIGLTADRNSVLEDLQAMGCVELIPLQPAKDASTTQGPAPGAEEALKFLRECPNRRRQVKDSARFDAARVEKQVLEVRQRLNGLEDERDFLIKRIQDLKSWGDFEYPSL
jgi:V/A-type H+-transporting ATPase subunit I